MREADGARRSREGPDAGVREALAANPVLRRGGNSWTCSGSRRRTERYRADPMCPARPRCVIAKPDPWVKKNLEAKLGLWELENEEHSPRNHRNRQTNPQYLRKLRPERGGPFPRSPARAGQAGRPVCPLCFCAQERPLASAPFIPRPPGRRRERGARRSPRTGAERRLEPGGHSAERPVRKLGGAGKPDSRFKARLCQAAPLGLGLLVCKMGPLATPSLRRVPGIRYEEAGGRRWKSTVFLLQSVLPVSSPPSLGQMRP